MIGKLFTKVGGGADTYSWKFQFIDQTDTIQIEVDATMLHTFQFASGAGANIGTIEVSTDGVNYTPIMYPFTPTVGTLYFKRSIALITATYTMFQ